jgi:hypothetical protein
MLDEHVGVAGQVLDLAPRALLVKLALRDLGGGDAA